MFINYDIVEELYSDAGSKRKQKAVAYVKLGRANITKMVYEDRDNFFLRGVVVGNDIYHVKLSVEDGEIVDVGCTCSDYYSHYGACKHVVAVAMEIEKNSSYYEEKFGFKNTTGSDETKPLQIDGHKYRNFKQIVNAFYEDEMIRLDQNVQNSEESVYKNKTNIKLEPKLEYDKYSNELKVSFKIGKDKMYVLKNLSEFYDRMLNEEKFKYGVKLEFVHQRESFDEDSLLLLDFILKHAEIIKYVNSSANSNYRYYGKALNDNNIILSNSGLDELFEILNGKKVILDKEYQVEPVQFTTVKPDIKFSLKKVNDKEFALTTNMQKARFTVLNGKKYKYVLLNNKLHRCDYKYITSTLKLLDMFRKSYVSEIILGEAEISDLYSVIVPKIKDDFEIDEQTKKSIQKLIPEKLGVKVYLDFDKNNYVIADVKFCYGNEEFNPVSENEAVNVKGPRNLIDESESLNMFRKTGFMLDTKNLRFILPQDDKIYNFLSNDILKYMQKFEVLATDNFKEKKIREPKIGSIGIRAQNNLLSIDFTQMDFDKEELKEIMSKYILKKKYHRLKDGTFLSLEENEDLEFLDKFTSGMDIDYKDITSGEIKLPISRSLYLNKLLENVRNTEINKNSEYQRIVNGLSKENPESEAKIPESVEGILRYYQKTGFRWLKTLDDYNFGGILADDMGLGKTIQMISILLSYIENTKKEERKPSIVVAPSSLALNWKNEVQKFTKGITALVIHGTAKERKTQIKNISNFDLAITSYDLLKRDIDVYKECNYEFRYIIADEAQYMKNSNTQNAKAIKAINAKTRFALTGTPIENSLAELWSIFDFIMPGYLFTYKKFKTLYEVPIVKDEDEIAMKKLKMMIEPFVLRRTKKEVLTELPDKTITVLNNEMTEEQKKIYMSYLARAKRELNNEILENGFEKSQIKILSLLTRLRQISCHPSLFIDNYHGGSSKLEQCLEIIKDGISSGHKILLFSGYTSMFSIIEKELKNEGINYYKLTGATKVNERINMVDEFNENKDIKVFLISLKAGGTGLNLTGADMVIHYDPWWNISAENQATDRAYRIGQKNNVQVYKLITKNSIEEKIYELQNKKAKLIDTMLDTKTSFISKLSKEEILSLFD